MLNSSAFPFLEASIIMRTFVKSGPPMSDTAPIQNTRRASVERNTKETQISVSIDLDGSGQLEVETGLPFLDHMLDQIARHGLLDLSIKMSSTN